MSIIYFVLVTQLASTVQLLNLDPISNCGGDIVCIQSYEALHAHLMSKTTTAAPVTPAAEMFSVTTTTKPLHDVFDLHNSFAELQNGAELTIKMRNGEQVVLIRKESQWWENWHTMSWSSLWHTVPFAIMCLIVGSMLMVLYPAVRYGVFPLVYSMFQCVNWLFNQLFKSYCWSVTCAGKPIVFVRKTIRRCWLNYWVCAKVTRAEEMVPLDEIVVAKSKFNSDENGMYLQTEGVKIYLDIGQDNLLATAPFLERDVKRGANFNTKETVVANSKYYKAEAIPAFQGWFEAGGIIIGYYSRIDYNGRDCLVTAFHVLEYNKMADIMICSNSAKLHFNSLEMKVVSYSKSDNLDYVLLEFPSKTFSILGLKIGKIAQTCGLGTPVSIYQMKRVRDQAVNCFSTGCVQRDDRCWFFKHGASTTVGCSGAPIIDVRRRIVGIHVEGGDSTFNCGVVPPFFRTKESPQNDDIVGGDDIPSDSDSEYSDEGLDSEDEFGDKRNKKGRRATRREKRDFERERALIMQEEDNRASLKAKAWFEIVDQEEEEQQGFKPSSVRKYKHGPVTSFGRKPESPWTCVNCCVTQEHHGTSCIKCGNPLIPASISCSKAKQAVATVAEMTQRGEGLPYPAMQNVSKQLESIVERLSKLEKIEAFFSNGVDKVGYGNYSDKAIQDLTSSMQELKLHVLEIDAKMIGWFKNKPPRNQVASKPTNASVGKGTILGNTKVETLQLPSLSKDSEGIVDPNSRRRAEIPVVPITRVKNSEKGSLQTATKEQKIASLDEREKESYQQLSASNQEMADKLLDWSWRTKQESEKKKKKAQNRRLKKKNKKESAIAPVSTNDLN